MARGSGWFLKWPAAWAATAAAVAVLGAGCGTVRQAALQGATSLISGDATIDTFLSDDDPELVRDSLPFAMKTSEVLVRQSPGDPGIRLTTGRLFIQYAYAFLETEADYVQDEDYLRAQDLRERACRMYLRGRDYVMDALELRHPDFRARLAEEAETALEDMREGDAAALYWGAAGWGGAVSCERGNMDLVADLPTVEAMMRRVLELDPSFGNGAVHEFFITYEGGQTRAMGGDPDRARHHFEEAVALSGGALAGPYLALAESVAVAEQDAALFRELLEAALAIDVSVRPEVRLLNVLAQRRAEWLLARMPELFLEYPEMGE